MVYMLFVLCVDLWLLFSFFFFFFFFAFFFFFFLFVVLVFSGSCLASDHVIGEDGASFFGLCACVLSVLVCLTFLPVSLVGYVLWFWLFLDHSDSNTDVSFTMAHSNSFFSPYEILPIAQSKQIFREIFLFCRENCMLCVLIRIASSRRF